MDRSLMKFLLSILIFTGLAFGQAWPGSVVTNATIPFAVDHSASTLSGTISNSALSIPVVSSSTFAAYEVINIDNEQLQVCSISSGLLTICTSGRGFFGTAPASHSSGASVFGYVNAGYHNTIFNELSAIETWLLTVPALPSSNNTFTGTNLFNGFSGFKNAEGTLYADQYGDHSTTGIAAAFGACSTNCLVSVPPTYPTSELIPGFVAPNSLTPLANSTPSAVNKTFDNRISQASIATNPALLSPNASIDFYNVLNWTNPMANGLNVSQNWNVEYVQHGGSNYIFNGVINKSNAIQNNNYLLNWTKGQSISNGFQNYHYSTGDTLGSGTQVICYGELLTGGDEGCEGSDVQIYATGSVDYGGAVTGTSGNTITINPSAGSGTQGEGRALIDITTGAIATSITAVTSSGTGPVVLTSSGTPFPVSTVIANLGTTVSPGTVTVTPSSYTVGSISSITTSTLVCVYDAGSVEMVFPTNVSGSSFTAVFANPHITTSNISAGGVCGYFGNFNADQQDSTKLPVMLIPIQGVIHQTWPMVASTSSSSAQMWVAGEAQWESYTGLWSVSNDGLNLFKGAFVNSVLTANAVSNTFTLAPNNATFTNGDGVFEVQAPNIHIGGNNASEKAFRSSIASNALPFMFMTGVWADADRYQGVDNATPSALYTANGGALTPPDFFSIQGEFNRGFFFSNGIDGPLFFLNCPIAGCSTVAVALEFQDAAGHDALQFDYANSAWYLTVGNNAHAFEWLSNGTFVTPAIQSNGLATIVGNETVGGTLGVTGAANLNGGAIVTGTFNVTGPYQTNGTPGFTGTKTVVGSCTFVIVNGLITNVTGC